MSTQDAKTTKREFRHRRIRARLSGTATRPRLAVFKSNRSISAQLIDDTKGVTVGSASSAALKGKPLEKARAVGVAIADLAKGKKITHVVFDRGGFLYAGHIQALADGAREGGLIF